jgi:hypothetical protein
MARYCPYDTVTVSPVDSVTAGNFESAVESAQYASVGADARRLESDISRSPASSSTCSCWRYRFSIAKR